uniref:CG32743 n=1 Tax=Macrostomum lignano TaxID=282301 RepID=A0A1I8J4U7_9PLAT
LQIQLQKKMEIERESSPHANSEATRQSQQHSSEHPSNNELWEEQQPLLSETQTQSLLVEPVVKLRCVMYLLSLVAVGFITSLIETEEFKKSNCHQNRTLTYESTVTKFERTFSPNEWVCWTVKNAYSISAIGVIFYLEKFVFSQSTIPRASMPHPLGNHRIVLTNVLSYIKAPKNMRSYPSGLFLITFIIFAVSLCLCGAVEIVCGIVGAADGNPQMQLAELFRRLLLVIFCLLQTRLFVVHRRHSVQWKLSATWLCGCHLLGMNIASWFFYVGLEIRQIGPACAEN